MVFLSLSLLGWALGFCFFLYRINHIPIPTEKTDGIVILTGGRERIKTGLALLQTEHDTPLLISGVHTSDQFNEIAAYAQKKDLITLGYFATNTAENADETKRWAHQYGFKSLTIVTSHYHLPRSLLELKESMPEVKLVPYPVFSPIFRDDSWIFNFKRWRILLWEYNKYVVILTRSLLFCKS